ncbi:hypothetical protein ACTFIW_012028 [Dictyostelium discoideum]|uniref:Cyclic AMP receptor 1 n=1 Tax=Dictyostelium discoideum TaxID=44689 RepID=CAR1_DICDI|nr:G-protein-coupled receptor [Dictyostelium discoideum AX4]XP_644648.1 G-protein-coupled receptor [Dictyostelium discoideum AX4]P13773.1 RecName: Full=Cyclic AMP receptor 1; Short=cAMP receptor 1 [Dictyostelium discoideum]AAA33177.1 cAMP receptor [Dictyostelium discoideum]EAL70653.1 G-protein-coupled receptor [Dictyostelium discoideum AX4]EAL70721.1 G-protein-coupled receptor [Dictyostelium discoideum AX4]|eukprot:XP_644603.1 G-protein-coupled receptor [Dictyostelium discoideum AX4]
MGLLDGNPANETSLVLLLFADFSSMLGCMAVLIGFWRLKLLRNHVTKVIACFCATSFCKDFPSTILTLTNTAVNGGFPCYLYAIVITYGSFACWLWTLCLAISIYMLIVKREPEPERFEKYYYLLCWGLPLISTIVMLAKNTVQFVGNWCWIGVSFTGYRFGLFYGPFLFIWAISAVLVGLTSRYTYVVIHNGVSDNKEKHLTYQFKLINYIIVFLVCWVFAVVNRIVNGLNMFPPALNILHTYLSVSHGFWASVTFIYNNPLMWRYFGAKILTVFTFFGYFTDVQKKLEKNKNNNNPSPYSSSRGTSGKTMGGHPTGDDVQCSSDMEQCSLERHPNMVNNQQNLNNNYGLQQNYNDEGSSSSSLSSSDEEKQTVEMQNIQISTSTNGQGNN